MGGRAGPLVVIRLQILSERPGTMRQASDLAVGVMFRMLRLFLGTGWRPRSISFTHAAPASTATSLQLFGMPADYGQDFDGIVCQALEIVVVIHERQPHGRRELVERADPVQVLSLIHI